METLLICKSCSNKFPIGDIRSDKSGSGWVCIKCYENQHPEVYRKGESKSLEKTDKLPTEPPKIRYYCSECGYKFQSSREYSRKCPYCNLYSVKEDKDAESFLQETIRENFATEKPQVQKTNPEPKIEIVED